MLTMKAKAIAGMIVLAVLLLVVGGAWMYHTTKVGALNYQIATQTATITEQATTIGELRNKIKEVVDSLRIAIDANDGLRASLKVQNEAIDKLRDEAARRARQAAAALAKAREETRKAQAKYNELLDAPPTQPGDMCRSLDHRLQQYIDVRHTEVAQ